MRSRNRKNPFLSGALTSVISALGGFAAVFASVLVIGLIMTKIDISEQVLSVLTSAGLCVGAFTGGYIASRRRRHNGLLMGLLCGLTMFGVIFVGSYIFAGAAGGFSASTKLIITLIGAGAGGIAGVNSNGTRFRLK